MPVKLDDIAAIGQCVSRLLARQIFISQFFNMGDSDVAYGRSAAC